jgi:hypothetical protein
MFGFWFGAAAIGGQYAAFQPLFRQMGLGPVSSAFGMLMFLTILTNITMIFAYCAEFATRPNRLARFFQSFGVRTAIAAHIALVAIVYVTAIRGQIPNMTPAMQVTDAMLHYIAPSLYLVWWWVLPDKTGLSLARIPGWMAWPVLYLAAIMTFGLMTGGYIYPVLDVNRLGAGSVAFNIAWILALLAGLCATLIRVAHWQTASRV